MYQLIQRNRNYLVVLMLTLFAGCTSVTTTTFNEKLVIGYNTVTQVAATTTQLLKAGKISPDDAENILKQGTNAKEGLDVARKLSGSDLTGANGKLAAVTSILSTLQSYLADKGK